ncbi:MAG: PD40 domain-containing protein [bacterium]|nr:PD40 domain-containing protein [bacterium]
MLRNSSLAAPVAGLRHNAQALGFCSASRRCPGSVLLLLVIVFSSITYATPHRVTEKAGRGCSSPLWGFNDQLIAYTTIDLDALFVIQPGDSGTRIKQQLQYQVAQAAGVGRRFIFDPSAERLIYRRTAAALKTQPDRLVATPFNSNENKMLTSNVTSILGPYRIGSTVYYRASLEEPLIDLEGKERVDGAYLDDGELEVKNAEGKTVFTSPSEQIVEGFERSPDGEWIAFVYRTGEARLLGVVEVSGGKLLELGKGRWPSWSGDSNRLVYVVDKPGMKFADIVVYDLQSAQSRSVQGLNQFWPDEPALNHLGTEVAFVHDGEIYVTEVPGF